MRSKITVVCSFILLSIPALAGAPVTPIDGGLSILLLIGGAFGLKKFIDARKD